MLVLHVPQPRSGMAVAVEAAASVWLRWAMAAAVTASVKGLRCCMRCSVYGYPGVVKAWLCRWHACGRERHAGPHILPESQQRMLLRARPHLSVRRTPCCAPGVLPWQRVLTRWLGRQQLRDYRTQLSSVPPAMHELQHLHAVLLAALRAASCKPASNVEQRRAALLSQWDGGCSAHSQAGSSTGQQRMHVEPRWNGQPHTCTSVDLQSVLPCSQRLQLHDAVPDGGRMIRCTMRSGCATGMQHMSRSETCAAQVARQMSRVSTRPSAVTVMDPSNNKAIQPAGSVLSIHC